MTATASAGIWTQPNNSTCHTVNHNAMCTTIGTNLTNTSVGGGYVNLETFDKAQLYDEEKKCKI